jgi:hypothetical protein
VQVVLIKLASPHPWGKGKGKSKSRVSRVHHKGWMVGGQETLLHQLPVIELITF